MKEIKQFIERHEWLGKIPNRPTQRFTARLKKNNVLAGVVIMATDAMKQAGGFDSSVGTYEKAIRYLKPLQNQLSCPMVLIGLKAPRTFRVEHDGKPKRARFVDIIE